MQQAATIVYLLNKVADHPFRDIEISDHAVT
jgi:hypothetical protein